MKLMDSHYCPMCGNLLPGDNAKFCLHCATPIDRPLEKPKAGGCLTSIVLAILLVVAILFVAR